MKGLNLNSVNSSFIHTVNLTTVTQVNLQVEHGKYANMKLRYFDELKNSVHALDLT